MIPDRYLVPYLLSNANASRNLDIRASGAE